jgi:hypothetical protein
MHIIRIVSGDRSLFSIPSRCGTSRGSRQWMLTPSYAAIITPKNRISSLITTGIAAVEVAIF